MLFGILLFIATFPSRDALYWWLLVELCLLWILLSFYSFQDHQHSTININSNTSMPAIDRANKMLQDRLLGDDNGKLIYPAVGARENFTVAFALLLECTTQTSGSAEAITACIRYETLVTEMRHAELETFSALATSMEHSVSDELYY